MKSNKKTDRIRVIWTIGLIVFSTLFVKAQANKNPEYLQKVGVLDSIYSDILNESRQIYIQLPASYHSNKIKNTQ